MKVLKCIAFLLGLILANEIILEIQINKLKNKLHDINKENVISQIDSRMVINRLKNVEKKIKNYDNDRAVELWQRINKLVLINKLKEID